MKFSSTFIRTKFGKMGVIKVQDYMTLNGKKFKVPEVGWRKK